MKLNLAQELRFAKSLCGALSKSALRPLEALIRQHNISTINGDVTYLQSSWYVTHSGLLAIARRRHCVGIQVHPVREFCEPAASRWAFKATVFKSRNCKGFVGYGDADPSNVSFLVHGAEMRVAETRAVNRALRKAYGSASAQLRRSGLVPSQRKCQNPGSFRRNPAAEATTFRRCVIVFVSLYASISSIQI
jgi:hypothetical protein